VRACKRTRERGSSGDGMGRADFGTAAVGGEKDGRHGGKGGPWRARAMRDFAQGPEEFTAASVKQGGTARDSK